MHPQAATVLVRLGGREEGFAARQLTPRVAADADLIVGMAAAHVRYALDLAPRQLKRTFLLTELSEICSDTAVTTLDDLVNKRPRVPSSAKRDVTDPIGMSQDAFDEVGVQIAELLAPVHAFCRRLMG